MSEAFLAVDAILNIYINVTSGLVVYPKVVEARIMRELPFIASENIMMDLVKKGGYRQEIHEKIRVHSIAAGKRVKEEGLDNDMIERICNDPTLDITIDELKAILIPSKYIGRCVEQVERFLKNEVDPVLEGADHEVKVELNV